jgi:hypothetical protein
MEFDLGRFKETKEIEHKFSIYLDEYTQFYKQYLKNNLPEFVFFFDEKLNEIKKDV